MSGPPGARRDGRGSASVLVAGLLGVLLVLSGAALVVGGFALAHHRARAAADLAAVSGATVFGQGADACEQARRSARDNGAEVLSCEQTGDQIDYVVTVRVAVGVRIRVPGLPDRVEARAHAGSVP
jgi:secretion/DNA translocation related TadE-like protein